MPVPPTTQAQLVSLIYEHQFATFEHTLRVFDASFPDNLWSDLLQCLRQLLQARFNVSQPNWAPVDGSPRTQDSQVLQPEQRLLAAYLLHQVAARNPTSSAQFRKTILHVRARAASNANDTFHTQQLATDGEATLPERVLLCQLLLDAAASVCVVGTYAACMHHLNNNRSDRSPRNNLHTPTETQRGHSQATVWWRVLCCVQWSLVTTTRQACPRAPHQRKPCLTWELCWTSCMQLHRSVLERGKYP